LARSEICASPSWFSYQSSILLKLEFGLLVFVEVGKPENPEKNPQSKARTNNKLNPDMAPGKIQIEKNLGTKC